METGERDLKNYDNARRAQEHLVHYLELPRAAEELGVYAVELLTRAKEAEVILPVRTGENILRADISHLRDGESVPIVAVESNDTVWVDHVTQSPEQYQTTAEVLGDTDALRNVIAPRACLFNKLGASHNGAMYPFNLWDGRITRFHASIHARPIVVLKAGVVQSPVWGSETLLHELTHASDCADDPLRVRRESDDEATFLSNMSLITELKAYALESRVSDSSQFMWTSHKVEAVRQAVNGDLFDNPHAFDPNDEIKATLATHHLDYIYYRTIATNDDTTLQN